MPDLSTDTTPPVVSIILPTYNRARFLPEAFAAIHAQQLKDWELIVINDGSTDDTAAVIDQLTADVRQPVIILHQENQGAYGARNEGLDRARGRYIAFYDSDDLWLPHHLSDCVEGLESNRDVTWVFGACRIVDEATGCEISPHTFYVNGTPRPFTRLKHRTSGKLHIVDDENATRCQILHGFYCGLQNSVIRRDLFEEYRFEASSRNEAEDQLVVIQALNAGRRFAWINAIHVDYRVHSANSSAVGTARDLERQERVLRLLAAGYERILRSDRWSTADRRALHQRLLQEYFWKLGYTTLWLNGRRREAVAMFRRGLRHWPWNLKCWKTYLVSRLRLMNSADGSCPT